MAGYGWKLSRVREVKNDEGFIGINVIGQFFFLLVGILFSHIDSES